MGPAQAIRTGFAKSFQFSGRASRSEFWWFAPIGVTLAVATTNVLPPVRRSLAMLAMQIFFIGVAFIPLAAAAARRYQDTGLPAGDLWQGSRPAVIAFVSGYFLFRSLQIMSMDFFEAGPAGLISGAIIFAIAILPFLVFAPVAPSLLGETIGQLLVPSQPHPNTYGPNPLEVTP